MATYGKAECAHCYGRLPKPEMRQVKTFKVVGRSPRRREYFNRFGDRTGTSNGVDTLDIKSRKLWLCGSCYKRWRLRRRIKVALVVALGILFFIALGNQP